MQFPKATTLALTLMLLMTLACGKCGGGKTSGNAGPKVPGRSDAATAPGASELSSETAIEETPPLPPTPDIALEVNVSTELTLYQGTPLIVTVRLANQRASNVLAMNAAQDKPEDRKPVPVVQLGTEWAKSVKFEIRAGAGGEEAAWPLALLGKPAEEAIALDGRTNPEAQWGLSPEEAAKIPPGGYRIVAVLEVSGRDKKAWKGRVESEPAALTIQVRPADLAGPAAAESDTELARYWAQAGVWDKSFAAARDAVAKDPKSIEAFTLVGDALASGNDLNGAMTAYQAALKLFRGSEEGKGYEPPDYLLGRISRIAKEKTLKDSASGLEKKQLHES